MIDVRLKDALRAIPVKFDEMAKRMEALEKQNQDLLAIVRQIKKTVVRKYGEEKDDVKG